jgi:hypothetical protein
VASGLVESAGEQGLNDSLEDAGADLHLGAGDGDGEGAVGGGPAEESVRVGDPLASQARLEDDDLGVVDGAQVVGLGLGEEGWGA